MTLGIFIRTLILGILQIAPFVLGALFCPYPLAIIFPCLLLMKNSSVSQEETTEIKLMLTMLIRCEAEKNPDLGAMYQPMRTALMHDQETFLKGLEDAARADMFAKTILGIVQSLIAYILIFYGVFKIYAHYA